VEHVAVGTCVDADMDSDEDADADADADGEAGLRTEATHGDIPHEAGTLGTEAGQMKPLGGTAVWGDSGTRSTLAAET